MDGGIGEGVRCEGVDRDDTRLGVAGEIHGAEFDGGVTGGLKEQISESCWGMLKTRLPRKYKFE